VTEDRGAQVAAERHLEGRTDVHGGERAGDLKRGDCEHDAAALEDIGRVAGRDAAVDDVAVDARQEQRRDGGSELEHDHRADR